ncbi:hypothetical protein BOX15_Mlig034480g2, partial [Macrostomum lignano]
SLPQAPCAMQIKMPDKAVRHCLRQALLVVSAICLAVWLPPADAKISAAPPDTVQPPLNRFGTKTAYRNVERIFPDLPAPSGVAEGCAARQLIMMLRHGSRGPSVKQVRRAEVVLHRLASAFRSEPAFAKTATGWSSPFALTGGGKSLSNVGHQEHELLGSRIALRYPNLLASHESVAVLSSSSDRAFESAKSFLHGAGLTDADIAVRVADAHIRFYDDCHKFKATIDDGPDGKREYRKFMAGPELRAAAKAAQERLGLTDIDLSPADLAMAFSLCGMEMASNLTVPGDSPWCRLVQDPDAHEAVEFLLDLKHYWRKSHGYDLSSLIACPLVSDLAANLVRAAQRERAGGAASAQAPVANSTVLYFGHAETLFPVMARLGLFKDPHHLTHESYAAHRQSRQFRASRLVPFGANFALSLLSCQDGGLYVQPALNESPLFWTLCNHYRCPLDDVLRMLDSQCPQSFDFEAVCAHKAGARDEL